MSVSTPILMTFPDKKGSIWAEAVAVIARTAAKPSTTASFIGISSGSLLHPDIIVQLVEVLSNILVVDHVDDEAMLDDIMAVRRNRKPTDKIPATRLAVVELATFPCSRRLCRRGLSI